MNKIKVTLQVPKMNVSIELDRITPLNVAIQQLKDAMYEKCPFQPTLEDVEDEGDEQDT